MVIVNLNNLFFVFFVDFSTLFLITIFRKNIMIVILFMFPTFLK